MDFRSKSGKEGKTLPVQDISVPACKSMLEPYYGFVNRKNGTKNFELIQMDLGSLQVALFRESMGKVMLKDLKKKYCRE